MNKEVEHEHTEYILTVDVYADVVDKEKDLLK